MYIFTVDNNNNNIVVVVMILRTEQIVECTYASVSTAYTITVCMYCTSGSGNDNEEKRK